MQRAFLIGLSNIRFYNKPDFDMPIKANFSTVTFIPKTKQDHKRCTQNLLGVNGNVEYNGYMSDTTKRKIKKFVTNYAVSVKNAELEGMCYVSREDKRQEEKYSTNNNGVKNIIRNDKIRCKHQCSNSIVVQDAVLAFHNSKAKGALRRRINFLTLTLPSEQKHSDNEIKRRCINRLLINLERNCDVKIWIWVAELQKNGNIHFHLLIDSYVPFVVISKCGNIIEYAGTRDKCIKYTNSEKNKGKRVINYAEFAWNNALDALGYIEDFAKKFRHRYPPTTQIEAIKGHEIAGQYITKYITKNNSNSAKNNRKIEGRLWGCCDALKEFGNIDITEDITKPQIKRIKEEGVLVVDDGFIKVFVFDIKKILPLFNRVFAAYEGVLAKVYPP